MRLRFLNSALNNAKAAGLLTLTPNEFLLDYERKSQSRRFDVVDPLISANAVFWFNDGSYRGKDAIRDAFEKTWSLGIQDESYWLDNIEWIVDEEGVAACTYLFHWKGRIKGELKTLGEGRGTCVIKKESEDWKIIHEHLSRVP